MTATEIGSTPRLRVESLTKSFFGVRALQDVSFTAHAGEVLGLVGENGSGKSTTMNILAGVLNRDSGRILLDGMPYEPKSRRESEKQGVAFIQQELNIFPNLTVVENLFLGRAPARINGLPFISRKRMRAGALEFLRAVDLEVDPDEPASSLNAGERQLLEIARALSTEARVVIFDEPTTSLTQREIEKLFAIIRRLCSRNVAAIYISHALQDVLQLAARIVVLRDGRVTRCFENEAVTPHDLVVAMVGRTIEALFPQRSTVTDSRPPVLEAQGVGQPGVVDDISLHVRPGEIVGLAGLMGSGRSELARILFGLDRHSSGSVRVDGRLVSPGDLRARLEAGMAFLTEDRRYDGLMMEASVIANISLAALPLYTRLLGVLAGGAIAGAANAMVQSMNVKCGDARSTPVRYLSGGNQQKVVLVKWLLRKPKVFIIDEPTRGVDVGAKEDIYRQLVDMASGGMAILMISSDLEELIGLCDRIHVMRSGGIHATFDRADFKSETILKAAFGQVAAA